MHDCSITLFLSLLWIHCFSLTIKFIFEKQSLFSLLFLPHRQYFYPKELAQSFLYPSNYTLIFYVYCILCWTEVPSLWDPCIYYPMLLNCSFLQKHLKAFSFLAFPRNFINCSGRLQPPSRNPLPSCTETDISQLLEICITVKGGEGNWGTSEKLQLRFTLSQSHVQPLRYHWYFPSFAQGTAQ